MNGPTMDPQVRNVSAVNECVCVCVCEERSLNPSSIPVSRLSDAVQQADRDVFHAVHRQLQQPQDFRLGGKTGDTADKVQISRSPTYAIPRPTA